MGKDQQAAQGKRQKQPLPKQNNKAKFKNKHKKKKNRADDSGIGIAPIEKILDQRSRHNGQQNEQESYNQGQGIEKMIDDGLPKLEHLAIAFPDSVLEVPQTSPLRAYFITQVARICSMFKVDEIVILKDHGYVAKSQNFNPSEYIARNLQYLESPSYLRKHLFKMHPDLKNASIMNPIECHHHLSPTDCCEFREGVTLDRPTKKGAGSWVDIGMRQQAQMNVLLMPNTRVTLRIKNYDQMDVASYEGQAVSKKVPRKERNLYWGYDVRIANSLKDLVRRDPKTGQKYDINVLINHHQKIDELPTIFNFQKVELANKSMLLFFSGTDNLSTLITRDEQAKFTPSQAYQLFDYSLGYEGFGVQKLRMQEQLFMGLETLSQFTY